MRTFVCIAGLREQTIREIHKSPAKFSGNASWSPICFPVDGPLSFRKGMSDRYLNRIRKEIEGLPALEPVSILLAYAAFDEPETKRFVRDFFPFSAVCSFEPFDDLKCAKHRKREELLKFLRYLERLIEKLRLNTGQVKDKLSGQNFSPLTLPISNFRSKIFERELGRVDKRLQP